jgi:hypothetical protein
MWSVNFSSLTTDDENEPVSETLWFEKTQDDGRSPK